MTYLLSTIEHSKRRDRIFKELLINDNNKFIISGLILYNIDCFWLVNCVFFHPSKTYHRILKKRIK